MTFNPDGVIFGLVVLGLVTGCLAIWPRRLSRVFAVCLAGLLLIELSFFGDLAVVVCPVWFAVHTPSRLALGTRLDIWPDPNVDDEVGTLVGTMLHLADILVWSALITGVFWFRGTRRTHDGIAEPVASPNGGPATPLGNSGVTEGPPSVS